MRPSSQHGSHESYTTLLPVGASCDFSAARPRLVARLARSDSLQSRGPFPRAGPPSPRPSRSASEVARSRLRGLPHALQSQCPIIELFFRYFSAARPRFVARLARGDSPQSRGSCPRADPPSPRSSCSTSEVARSRLRGLPHAPYVFARTPVPIYCYLYSCWASCRACFPQTA